MTLRAQLVAAVAALVAAPALAADLDYTDRSPYDDPRYSDIYSHPAPPPPRYAYPVPPAPVYRDDRYAAPPQYVPPPPPHRQQGRHAADCVPRAQVRHRLESRGWHDFHDAQPMGEVVHIRARRPSGRLFDLTLDRCSGEVLGVEAIDHRAAAAPPPPPPDWRWRERPYGRY
jgi:hypothetical protein